MSLQFKKLHQNFGVEIINFNLSKDLNNNSYKEILFAFNEYGILLFRSQNMSLSMRTIAKLFALPFF